MSALWIESGSKVSVPAGQPSAGRDRSAPLCQTARGESQLSAAPAHRRATRPAAMPEYRISADAAGQRLDKFLRRALPDLPGSALYKLIRTKKIRVNGVKAQE